MEIIRHIKSRSEKGQSIILFALAFVALLGFVSLAVDTGMIYMTRGNQQGASDAAAFAGALKIVKTENWQSMSTTALQTLASAPAVEVVEKNGFKIDGKRNVLVVNYPPATGIYMNDTDYLQVLMTSEIQTSFLHIVWPGVMKSTTEAVVHITGAKGGQPMGGTGALIATNKTACKSFYASNNAKINVKEGGIFVNSNCSSGNGAMYVTGSASVNILTAGQGISVIGSYSKDNNGQIKGPSEPVTGGVQRDFPDINLPDCNDKKNFGSYSNDADLKNRPSNYSSWQPNPYILKPGVYPNGITVANGMAAELQPGLYCVSGNVNFNGSKYITGNGVMFVMKGGSFTVGNGTSPFTVQSPSDLTLKTTDKTEVNFKGMLILANPSFYTSAKTFKYEGGASTSVMGTIYAPKTKCIFNNGTSNTMYSAQVVCDTIEFAGGSGNNFTLSPGAVFGEPGGGKITIELAQ